MCGGGVAAAAAAAARARIEGGESGGGSERHLDAPVVHVLRDFAGGRVEADDAPHPAGRAAGRLCRRRSGGCPAFGRGGARLAAVFRT